MEKDLLDASTFSSLDLDNRLLKALSKLNYKNPTLIQSSAIPLALQGKDILAKARTGSGKTAAYILPILQKILSSSEKSIKALILVPTKELCDQVSNQVSKFLMFCSDILCINLASQERLGEQPDILVSTPSKVLSLLKQDAVDLSQLDSLVIDEADLILSYGYNEDMKEIMSFLPRIYQSFLMSATLSSDVEQLKGWILKNPAILKLNEASSQLVQYSCKTTENEKFLLLFFILKLKLEPFHGKVVLFVNSIDRCYKLKLFLEQFGIRSCALNASLPLKSRFHIVQEFNRGIYDIIIATDEETTDKKKLEYGVSRGVDFKYVQAVINFDMPVNAKSYTHRVGRTARGVGNKGTALTFVTENDEAIYQKVQKKQSSMGATIADFTFDMTQVEAFKYRVEDALRAVTSLAVKEAQLVDVKKEILNSAKLKAHFEENPRDLLALRHDKEIHPARIQPHMKHVPDYLLPNGRSIPFSGKVPFKVQKRKKKKDSLKHFK